MTKARVLSAFVAALVGAGGCAAKPPATGGGGGGNGGGGSSGDGSAPAASGLPVPPGAGGLPRPSGAPGNLRVLDWAGFKSALTYTFDDAQPSQIEHYADLQASGVPLTFF